MISSISILSGFGVCPLKKSNEKLLLITEPTCFVIWAGHRIADQLCPQLCNHLKRDRFVGNETVR